MDAQARLSLGWADYQTLMDYSLLNMSFTMLSNTTNIFFSNAIAAPFSINKTIQI